MIQSILSKVLKKNPAPQSALDIAGAQANAGFQRAQDERAKAMGLMSAPLPELVKAEVDPIESIIAAVTGLAGGAGSQFGQRAFNAPMLNAQTQADQTNQQGLLQYKQNQTLGNQQLDSADRLLSGYMDRQSAIEKIRADREQKNQERDLKERLAASKEGNVLAMSLARLGDNMNPVAIKTILSQMPQNQGLGDLALDRMAQSIYQDSIANPSFRGQIEREKLTLNQQKEANDRTGELEKIAGDDVNHSPQERYLAGLQLRNTPGSIFEGMTQEQVKAHVETMESFKAAQVKAQTNATTEGVRQKDEALKIQRERIAQASKQWSQRFKFMQSKQAQDLGARYAAIQVAQQNADTAKLRTTPEFIALTRSTADETAKVLKSLRRDVANLDGMIRANPGSEKVAEWMAKKTGIESEMGQVIKDAVEADIDSPALTEAMTQIANTAKAMAGPINMANRPGNPGKPTGNKKPKAKAGIDFNWDK